MAGIPAVQSGTPIVLAPDGAVEQHEITDADGDAWRDRTSTRAGNGSGTSAIDWAQLPVERTSLNRGDQAFAQGASATSVFFFDSGTIKLSIVSRGGKEAVVTLVQPSGSVTSLRACLPAAVPFMAGRLRSITSFRDGPRRCWLK
jgi:hypothetical protein